MRTKRARATRRERTIWPVSLLTRTSRYQPTLMSSASPRASFGSLLFSLTERAACAWRASIQTTGRLMRLSSCQSQLAIAPVSKPIRSVGAGMGSPLKIKEDRSPAELRRLARRERGGRIAARLYAIANALDGMSRAAAAQLAGMERQGTTRCGAALQHRGFGRAARSPEGSAAATAD